MNKYLRSTWVAILLPATLLSQKPVPDTFPHDDNPRQHPGASTLMPYNRLLHSAGKVISFGDSSLENHTLDLCIMPDKKNLLVEDRYGIALISLSSNAVIARWSFRDDRDWKSFVSTYSGITYFTDDHKTYIAWGAAAPDSKKSVIMIAEWDGKKIAAVSGIPVDRQEPAGLALPNQVVAQIENGVLYIYAVLNGNDQLIKIRFSDRSIVWTARTGVAPFAACIVHKKIYVSNWAGTQVTDTSRENAGTPWGRAYTDPVTGATERGSLSVIDIEQGALLHEIPLGLHPNAIVKSTDDKYLYIANANSDYISVVDVKREKVVDSIPTGIFSQKFHFYGSSPNALALDPATNTLYVANGMDNALAVLQLGSRNAVYSPAKLLGFIPTEAYPSAIVVANRRLYIGNLEARGAGVLSPDKEAKKINGNWEMAFTIHKELASCSVVAIPSRDQLALYTKQVTRMNLFGRIKATTTAPRKNVAPVPLPERIGEPSVFRHVIYIIKENKTYDQVLGDISVGRGDRNLCIYGEQVTPNQHRLAGDFCLLDNYYASGKSSAEGHQWTDA
ncbi:MAG TPA: hypothetical protein VMI35_05290, partial [Puia sp.]|nr:hypothetical protein [Puia sp.]